MMTGQPVAEKCTHPKEQQSAAVCQNGSKFLHVIPRIPHIQQQHESVHLSK